MTLRRLHGVAAALLALAACGPATETAPPAPSGLDAIPAGWQYPLSSAQPVTAAHGMVVTDAPLATQVGLDVLQKGGNAVDAAVATAFALAVVYPEAGNLGGGGFMVIRQANGDSATLDFREEAPSGATRDMYIGPDGKPTDASVTGHLASGVPGSVAGLWAAHERYGSIPWKDLVRPAIDLARNGFTVDEDLSGSIRDEAERLKKFPAAMDLYMPNGEPLAAGSTFRNPDLAATLQRIADGGADGFYKGETARLVAAEMKRGGGLITAKDLASYQAKWRDPVAFRYRGNTIISMPPPSSGGITLAEALHMMEQWDVGSMGWHSTAHLHLLAEVMRRAFADRNYYLGDPDFVDMPRDSLVSEAYARRRAATIDTARATRSDSIHPGLGSVAEPTHTTHFSIVDAQGDAVATTTTLNALYGSAVAVKGAGFMMNDEMDDFAAKPGSPNMYGLVQGEQNAIRPGKRMLSAMSPTVVVGPDGRVRMVTGARGGPRIITAVLQVLSNVLDFDMGVGDAVYAPRVHHQHLPDTFFYEDGGLTDEQIQALEAMGHHVEPRDSYIGNAPTIVRTPDGWSATPDPRQGGKALGY